MLTTCNVTTFEWTRHEKSSSQSFDSFYLTDTKMEISVLKVTDIHQHVSPEYSIEWKKIGCGMDI